MGALGGFARCAEGSESESCHAQGLIGLLRADRYREIHPPVWTGTATIHTAYVERARKVEAAQSSADDLSWGVPWRAGAVGLVKVGERVVTCWYGFL